METYGNDCLSRPERTFQPDGSIKSEYWNVDGARDGTGRTWFPNGQMESETQYDHAKVIHRKLWSEDGTEPS